MNALTAWIAKKGMDSEFIAGNAHCWFAFSVVTVFGHAWVGLPFLALAAVKEFWFDANFETPTQTAEDNLIDFGTYLLGVSLAWIRFAILT